MKIAASIVLLVSMLVVPSGAAENRIRGLGIGLEPTDPPTKSPTQTPVEAPTETPVEDPTETPVEDPTETPAEDPTDAPSVSVVSPAPTGTPTGAPETTDAPTDAAVACQTIAEIACTVPDFSTLCELLGVFELGDALSGGNWTIFAPNNTAFAAVADIAATLEPETILNVLLFHAVSDAVLTTADLSCDGFLTMANGQDSQTICDVDTLMVFQVGPDNAADMLPEIVSPDISACNGIIHVVNNVMLPEGTLPDSSDTSTGAPGGAVVVEVSLVFDSFAPETGWQITDSDGNVIDSVPIGTYPPLTESATEEVELVSGADYTFTIFDLFGEGMSNPTDGTYTVTQDTTTLVSGGGNFGKEESTTFTTL